jgi:hypothetical protein
MAAPDGIRRMLFMRPARETETRYVPRPTHVHNADFEAAIGLFTLSALVASTFPGAVVGALLATAVWRVTRPDIITKWLFAGLGGAMLASLHSSLAVGWPFRAVLHLWFPESVSAVSPQVLFTSSLTEVLAGPALLLVFETSLAYWHRTIQGQEWSRYHSMTRRKKALERDWAGPPSWSNASSVQPGALRLGYGAEDGRPIDIGADELAQHIFVPGASGSGKTTTLVTIAEGALANGYGIVIVDCKGSGLGGEARKLAARNDVPFTTVDPKSDDTVGYDPCSGDAADIANKLIGTFSFSGEAEIYKQVAMEVVPLICKALQASGSDVTIDAIYEALNRGGLSRIGRRPGADAYRDRLEDLDDSGGVGAQGYSGLQRRLGALREGRFGDIFRTRPALDWKTQLRTPQVTYLALPSTAASEDVELFGRVITQDLKQVCYGRMQAIEAGEDIAPILIIYDEFAALREATQIVDLLLQARQARAPLVVSTQYLPEEVSILRPITSAGILIVHRLEAVDAESIAAQFGTHNVPELTAQVDYLLGTSQKGSVRFVKEYNVHPDDLKELPIGVAAVYLRPTQRRKIVRIAKLTT